MKRFTLRKRKKLYGYICGNAATDVWIGANDQIIYTSPAEMKKRRTCWKECGIYRIDLTKLKCVLKGKDPR